VLEFHVAEFGVVTGLDYEATLTCVALVDEDDEDEDDGDDGDDDGDDDD
jgi:hypothetical protein